MNAQHDVSQLPNQPAPLPLVMRDAYLDDLQGWVVGMCRVAARAERSTLSMIDALFGRGGSAATLARWRSIGPHAVLRRDYQLSEDAMAILLLASAPYLWGTLTHVYAALVPQHNFVIGLHMLVELHGDRATVLRELSPEAPLVRCGLVKLHPSGAVVPSGAVIARLAGTL